jgi:6,7-dimethyl-8-ribityllumazine synthase
VQVFEGQLLAGDDQFAIIVSRFNDLITRRLLDGAIDTLKRHGLPEAGITVVHVPGSFEIPIVAQRLAHSGKFAAVICLGAVIQGETTHHEYINHQMAGGILQSSLTSGIPVTFGVLTCQSMDQALDRAGGKAGNKGVEATLAAIETVDVLRKLAAVGI